MYRKFLRFRGLCHYFVTENFCPTVPKNFVVEPFRVLKISGIEKTYTSEGYVTIFRRKFFVSQYRNISYRNRSVMCFKKLLVAKKFMDKREGEVSRFSVEIFSSHSAEKICWGTFYGVINSGYGMFLCFLGLCHDFQFKFCLSHGSETFRRGALLCCISESFW